MAIGSVGYSGQLKEGLRDEKKTEVPLGYCICLFKNQTGNTLYLCRNDSQLEVCFT